MNFKELTSFVVSFSLNERSLIDNISQIDSDAFSRLNSISFLDLSSNKLNEFGEFDEFNELYEWDKLVKLDINVLFC